MKQFLATLLCFAAFSLSAVTWLDSQLDPAHWKFNTKADTLVQSENYVYHQGFSLNYKTPKYVENTDIDIWPCIEAKFLTTDWTKYDRLVLFFYNPHEYLVFINGYVISTAQEKFDAGAKPRFLVKPRGFTPVVINLKEFPDQVNQKEISSMYFYLPSSEQDVEFYISGMCLLEAGEEIPDTSERFAQEAVKLCKERLNEVAPKELGHMERLAAECQDLPVLQQSIQADIQRYKEHLAQRFAELDAPPQSSAALAKYSGAQISISPAFTPRFFSALNLKKQLYERGYSNPSMLVGTADSMTKILPTECAFELDASGKVALSMSRYEYESVQVVVTPAQDKPLKNVKVEVVDLKDAAGNALQAEVDLVGYVQTKNYPPFDIYDLYLGWWPDPIMKGRNSCDIDAEIVQSFWVRLHTTDSQPAGKYSGTIRVSADNAPEVILPLEVTVRSFILPKHAPMPLAVSININNSKAIKETIDKNKLKFVYADFLTDYLIDYDCLYNTVEPDWEILKYLHDNGRLTAFNFGFYAEWTISKENFDADMKGYLEYYRGCYEKAKELGILDHAYIYGADETSDERAPILQMITKRLHEEFPDVLTMTTAFDKSYGFDTGIKDIDIWVPGYSSWDEAMVQKARANGDYVWWYIACWPWHPYLNWFIEFPLIHTRLLMGAMAAKYRPEGFLYYAVSYHPAANKAIDLKGSTFTEWNPVSYDTYHGDGSLLCVAEDGHPLPTIRLENFRDGLEDYAYAILLDDAIRKISALPERTADQEAWLARAKDLVTIKEELIKDITHYTENPAVVRAWREAVAQAIDDSGVAESLNPWKDANMGVRGLRK